MILVQEVLFDARGAETGNSLSSAGTKNNTVNNCFKASNSLNAIALFSGGGGLDLGFSAAGFNIRISCDIDAFSCKTLELNNGKRPFYNHAKAMQADITKISANDLLENANLDRESVDLLIGGPPCQAFSIFGQRKGLNDPRGNLVWDYLRILQEIQPTAFVFENVAGLKSIHNGSLYNEILHSLELGGLYTVSAHSYQLANFGIPQFRDRIFFIGTKTGKLVPILDSTHGNSDCANAPYRTASEALRQRKRSLPPGSADVSSAEIVA